MNSLSQPNIQQMQSLSQQQQFNQSLLTFPNMQNEDTSRYYHSQYAKAQPPLQRQEYFATSSYDSQSLLQPINDLMLRKCFNGKLFVVIEIISFNYYNYIVLFR